MALELKAKSTFLAVELLVFIPSLEEYISLKSEVYKFGREYYFVTKQLNKYFMYYHINTFETSASFNKIIDLSLKIRKFLLSVLPDKDFMIYAFSRVIEEDKPENTDQYQKRILYLYKNIVLRSFCFVDNYIHNEMRDDYEFRKISEKEFLLTSRRNLNKSLDLTVPIMTGRDSQLEFVKKNYDMVCNASKISGYIDINSVTPNLLGIKSAPGVGKSSFVQAIIADLSYFYSSNFYVVSKLTRNNAGPFHPFLTMLSDLLEFKLYNSSEISKNSIFEKKIEYFSTFIEQSDLSILKQSLHYIYSYSIKRVDEDTPDLEKFSVAIMSIFNVLIKIVYKNEQRPFIFIFEDIHKYSKESLSILENLLKNFSMIKPAIFILTYNYYYVPALFYKFSLKEVTLDTFDFEDTKTFVSTFAPMIQFKPGTITDLYMKSCGHPYYIERYLTKVIEGVYSKNANGEIEFPENIQSVICGKLHYVPDNLHYILQILSVIGNNFDLNVFEYILAKTDFKDTDINLAITELSAFDIISYKDKKVFFKMPFYKNAIYETIPHEIKQQLHRMFAEFNEDEFKNQKTHKLKPIYENYLQSNTPEKAIPYLVYKVEEFAVENRINDAKNLINIGLKKSESFDNERKVLESRVRLHIAYITVLNKSGERKKEKKLIDKIESEDLTKIKSQNIKSIHALKKCQYNYEMNKFSEVYDISNEIIPELEKQNDKVNLMNAFILQAEAAYQLKGGKTAISLYNRIQNHTPSQLQLALINFNRGQIYYNLRYYSEAIKSYFHTYTVYGEYRRSYSQFHAGFRLSEALTMIGDYQNSLIVLNYLLGLSGITNNVFDKINVNHAIANNYNFQNNFTNANKFYMSTLAVTQNFQSSEIYCEVLLDLVDFCLKFNKLDEATLHMETLLKRFEKLNNPNLKIRLIATKSLYYIYKNNPVGARTALESVIEDILKADLPDKEIYLNKAAIIIEKIETQYEKFKYKSAIFYKKAYDFVVDKISKISDVHHKSLVQNQHSIDSKILKNIRSPF